jgi:membrane protease YdiL (CAAX protease family)
MKIKIYYFLTGSFLAFASIAFNVFSQKIFGFASLNTLSWEGAYLFIHPFLSSLATGFFEEVIFRLILLTFLIKTFKLTWLAIIVESLIFALVHAGNSHVTELALISHFFGALVYSFAFIKTKKIWLPFGLHFGWNYSQILFGIPMSGTAYYSIFETEFYTSEFFSGGLYGFEGGILSILSRLLLLALLYFIPLKFNQKNHDHASFEIKNSW